MTEKLYYTNSHISEFTARVLSCERTQYGYAVSLDRTAFFPGGGGQERDSGYIASLPVLDMEERDGGIFHLLPEPLAVGSEVSCAIDWETRFARMQAHSGEHIVSGTVHRLYGYENTGFHMGADGLTVDFSGLLSPDDVEKVEREANAAVWRDAEVTQLFPTAEELKNISYRSKKELSGQVRIVVMDGVDSCACCAPHVLRTGEVGIIKIISCVHFRGGSRVSMLCGRDALLDYMKLHSEAACVSAALSAPRTDTAAYVSRVLSERDALRGEIISLKRELLNIKISALPETEGNLCLFETETDLELLRELCNAGMKRSGGICAVFSGSDGDWKYVMGSKSVDLRKKCAEINSAISGRGGGKPSMIQGSARAKREEIEKYFS